MQLKTLSFGIIIILCFLSVTAIAGTGHTHGPARTPVDQASAKTIATEIVAGLVKRNKLDKSWASIAASSVEKKVSRDNTEWVVVFVNRNITDTAKQTFYVFLTLGGEYIAANYSGE